MSEAHPVRILALTLLGAGLAVGCSEPGGPAPGEAPAAAPTAESAQRVQVSEAHRDRVGGLSGVSGITEAFRSATVAAEVNARVIERHVEPGQLVAAGDPLVDLDDTQLAIAVAEAEANLGARRVDVAEARRAMERGEELRAKGVISEGRHDDLRFAGQRARSALDLAEATLKRARRSHADAVVRAPFAGTVERVDVQVGDFLPPGAPVATLADFAQVRLRAGVTATEASALTPGSEVTVLIPALGGFRATADIHSIAHMADPRTGTYPVEIWLENPALRIRGGMVGEVRLAAPADSTAVVVPRAAILRRAGQLAVYIVEEHEGTLRAFSRPVQVGRQQGEFVELLEGVAVGERVVVDGLFALTDGTPVYVDEQRVPQGPQAESEAAWRG